MTGEKIRKYRKLKGLTQTELGEMVGLTGVAIMHYEKGQRKVKDSVLQRIVDVLEIPEDELVSGDLSDILTEDLIRELEKRGGRVKFISNLCKVLGVEPCEEFRYDYEDEVYRVNVNGRLEFQDKVGDFYLTTTDIIYDMIEHPELIRKKVK